ncbi:MAG: precorrin-3B C(17)-methyltransferase [Ignisphaera sp.]|nr:precorrin-3B C(17)-methyltransferase [Ignisphaera sp.]MDW8086276.1 precorrin-3B C(17)-methyltransferase [Ignisphaera sp.]
MARGRGRVYVVGIGPGDPSLRTQASVDAIRESSTVIGYTFYLDLVRDLLGGKSVVEYGMGEEVKRVQRAIELAQSGEVVSLISGGDPQVFGIAALFYEYMARNGIDVEVYTVPGVTAALAAASKLGSPLSSDFAVINLSDLLVSRDEIALKVDSAARGDFVIVFYNPAKLDVVRMAMGIVARYRSEHTPVGIARNVYRRGEKIIITTLGMWQNYSGYIDMRTTIIVGSSKTFTYRSYMVTPRGYRL